MAAVLPQTAGSLLASRQRSAAGCVQPRRPQAAARGLVAWRQCRAAPVFAAASGIEADAAEELQEIEEEFEDEDDGVGLTTQQVESFLQTLCEDTEIVDLELKMGSFSMKVRRSLTGGADGDSNGGGATAASPLPSPVATQSLDMAQFQPLSPAATQSMSFDEEDDSESLVMIESPKVGVLRRGKYFKGKKVGKDNLVEEGDKVKKGQHVGYVEQLGTFVPIEAPQAGEILGFVVDDGKPVEYGETVVELAPFFGGHIIGDLKYA